MKLGRAHIKHDTRTLRLAQYFTAALPASPEKMDWSKGLANWGMMLNDQLGDCTIAGAAHAVQVWTANTGSVQTVADADVLAAYEQWDGYNPKDPSTDQGGVELDVLKRWRGSSLAGHNLLAFADVNPRLVNEVRQGIALFGGLYIGLSLPVSAQTQDVWDAVADDGAGNAQAGSWGGHCVYVLGYDAEGLTCITWGQLKCMTWAFWLKYCDEAHVLLGGDWLEKNGSPAGFDQAQLEADLKLL